MVRKQHFAARGLGVLRGDVRDDLDAPVGFVQNTSTNDD